MRSEAQREASRINGAKSRGPKSPGTGLAKFNGLKHGLRAEEVVLPGEDPAEFEAERRGFLDEWAPPSRTRALLVFGLDPLVVAGPNGFAGELLEDAGGENAAGDNALPFFRLSTEAAVRSAPQVIVLCGVEAPAGRRPIPGLNTRVTSLRSTALLHPGPRLPEALADLRAALAR